MTWVISCFFSIPQPIGLSTFGLPLIRFRISIQVKSMRAALQLRFRAGHALQHVVKTVQGGNYAYKKDKDNK